MAERRSSSHEPLWSVLSFTLVLVIWRQSVSVADHDKAAVASPQDSELACGPFSETHEYVRHARCMESASHTPSAVEVLGTIG